MANSRLQPSQVKNKIKREELLKKARKEKRQHKLQKRLSRAKEEAHDPLVKKKRLAENLTKTLDNSREYDPSVLIGNTYASQQQQPPAGTSKSSIDELQLDINADNFASYFNTASINDSPAMPKVLITTSVKATKATHSFCNELVNVIPGAEIIRRRAGKEQIAGNIASWAAKRGYTNMLVVNEDHKNPNGMTMIHLPDGPSAYFKLSSVQLSKTLSGHARPTEHFPELVLNNFATRLGHTVGRMFQTLFPPMPEFQGRQVVTIHNQRDFIFFRRHRYAFRSTEKAALQEIGPRFTLKLRWMKRGVPGVQGTGDLAKELERTDGGQDTEKSISTDSDTRIATQLCESEQTEIVETKPSTYDEFVWQWKPELETTRRTFFL